MLHVFVSFTGKNQPIVDAICNEIEQRYDVECYRYTVDNHGTSEFDTACGEAIRKTDAVLFMQSYQSIYTSVICPKEIALAVKLKKPIIPLRLDDAELSDGLNLHLSNEVFIIAKGKSTTECADAVYSRLLEILSVHSRRHFLLQSNHFEPSVIFEGRDELICRIDEKFNEGTNTVFLHGMGGIGKSELAMQYCKKYHDYYTTVVFAKYDQTRGLAALIADDSVFSIEGLMRKTKSDGSLQSDEEYCEEKCSVLKEIHSEHVLVIIDNYDRTIDFKNPSGDDQILINLMGFRSFRLLITTRYQQNRKRCAQISVEELDDESLKLIFLGYMEDGEIKEDDPGFPELFDITGRHTMTLEMLAGFVNNTGINRLSVVIGKLKSEGIRHWQDSDEDFEIIKKLFRLNQPSTKEQEFLCCLSLVPLAGINNDLFCKWFDADTIEYINLKQNLKQMNLIKYDVQNEVIYLHPIVRECIKSELMPSFEKCKIFIENAALVHIDYVPMMWGMSYSEKKAYMDTYRSIVRNISLTRETFEIYYRMSSMYNFVADYSEAMPFLNSLYSFACATFGEQSEQAMLILNNIGWKYSFSCFKQTALPIFKKVADYFIAYPDYHSRSAHSTIYNYVSIAAIEYQNGAPIDISSVMPYLTAYSQYAGTMVEVLKSENNPSYYMVEYTDRMSLRSLFLVHLKDKQYKSAEEDLIEMSKTIDEYRKYPDVTSDVDYGDLQQSWALLYIQYGDYDAAYQYFQKHASTYAHFFGLHNLSYIESKCWMAKCKMETKEYAEACRIIYDVMEPAENVLTKDHPLYLELMEMRRKLATTNTMTSN